MFACDCDDEIIIPMFMVTFFFRCLLTLGSWRFTITVVTVTFSFLFDDDASFQLSNVCLFMVFIGVRLANYYNVCSVTFMLLFDFDGFYCYA